MLTRFLVILALVFVAACGAAPQTAQTAQIAKGVQSTSSLQSSPASICGFLFRDADNGSVTLVSGQTAYTVVADNAVVANQLKLVTTTPSEVCIEFKNAGELRNGIISAISISECSKRTGGIIISN